MSQRRSRRTEPTAQVPENSYIQEWNNETEEVIKMKLENCVCPICIEIADKAVLTKCCRKVYCELHVAAFATARQACPTCRDTPFRYEIAQPERDYIARFATKCPFCETEQERGHLEEHKSSCERRPDPDEYSAERLFPGQYAH